MRSIDLCNTCAYVVYAHWYMVAANITKASVKASVKRFMVEIFLTELY